MNQFNRLRRLGAVLAVALLAACAAPQPAPTSTPDEARQASSAQARGDWATAAPLWQAAASSPGIGPGEYNLYLLNAADAWQLAGDRQRADATQARVDVSALSRAAASRHALLGAELALADGDVQRAEFYLQAAGERVDLSLRPRQRQAKQQLETLRNDPSSQSIAAAAEAIHGLDSMDVAQTVAILRLLQDVPSARLASLAEQPSQLAPWAQFALSVRLTLIAREDLLSSATLWETQHPGHPVNAARYLEACWMYGQSFTPPRRIAVLLPDEGNLAAAGAALRDGLISAYLERPGDTTLNFFPAGEDPVAALMAYSRAAELGYDWVIGPLDRQAVNMIAELENPPIPVLLLNEPGSEAAIAGSRGNAVYSLSLSQQEEARAVARKMLDGGLTRVLALVADNAWGDRTLEAFSREFLAGEGEITATGRFGRNPADHADFLTVILRIEDSRQRKDSLQADLRTPLQFEPTRRDDFDAIFLAADPVLGRQLKPQLRFYDAGGKPMYAMSRIFSGQPDPAADQDLNGVLFATTTWSLIGPEIPTAQGLESVRGGTFGHLHQLGGDAWNILPWLEMLAADPDLVFPGEVGGLTLGNNGQIKREPVWAEFVRGRPVREMPEGGP